MPFPRLPIPLLLAIYVTIVALFIEFEGNDDCNWNGLAARRSQAIGNTIPRDMFGDIHGTVWFRHYCGISESCFAHIYRGIGIAIYEARNIYFLYDPVSNAARRRRACKISNRNRIIQWLHQMRTGQIIWNAAFEHGWNVHSASVDFFHVTFHFVTHFYDEWINRLTPTQRQDMAGSWPSFPTAYQALDGSQFLTTKSKTLPDGYNRRDVYCWKTRHPQGKNVQAAVSHFGHCTELMIGMFYVHFVPAGSDGITW